MRVHIEQADFGRIFNIWILEEGPYGIRLLRPLTSDDGSPMWQSIDVPEGTVSPQPSIQIDVSVLNALREALYPMEVKADEELVRRLKLEEGRVDMLIRSSITIAEKRF